ncbi:MAG: NAD-dependent epimerase/dehydratase family protein [Oligoflexus sp.]
MKRILVTGGGGFLGQAICRQLVQKNYRVRAFNRQNYAELQALGIELIQGDLCNKEQVVAAAKDCDAIIHTAAKAGVWGSIAEYEAINVMGTRHVLAACDIHNIRYLVYTSSPSVVFDGKDQNGVDESVPYPDRYLAGYPQTKAQAEREVIAANNQKLKTVSLRPHLIWGPGDPHLAPRLIERARQGRLRLIDRGEKLVDTVYVDNAAAAHILALEDLLCDQSKSAGQVYFITNQEPWPLSRVVENILHAAGLDSKVKSIPQRLALPLATLMEQSYRWLGIRREPLLTPFVVKQLATAHWYDPKRAQQDLQYAPKISMEEGMNRLQRDYKRQAMMKTETEELPQRHAVSELH